LDRNSFALSLYLRWLVYVITFGQTSVNMLIKESYISLAVNHLTAYWTQVSALLDHLIPH
jgi:hypothetical protein